jgi:tetratricopeptide (TPR) repeat protein
MFAIHAPEQAIAWEAEQEPRRAALVCLRDLDQLRLKTRELLRSAYWELGEVNLRMGDPAAAARAFELLAEIKPPTKQHFDVLLKAGSAWKQAGDFEKALSTFEDIVRYASEPGDNLRGQLAIGDLWLDSGNPTRSLGAYLRIINFYDDRDPAVRPYIARALLQSGLAFQKLGKTQEARRQLETLLRDFARDGEVKELVSKARALLDTLSEPRPPASAPS